LDSPLAEAVHGAPIPVQDPDARLGNRRDIPNHINRLGQNTGSLVGRKLGSFLQKDIEFSADQA
jgi:hypothetical protein